MQFSNLPIYFRKPQPENFDVKNKIVYFLPTGHIRLQIFEPEGKLQCEIKVTEIYVPDVSKSFFVEYHPSILSDDSEVKVTVNKQGFLAGVLTKTEDKTPAIIAALGQIARTILRLPAAPPMPLAPDAEPLPCKLDMTFDPFNPVERAHVLSQVQMQRVGQNVTALKIEPVSANAPSTNGIDDDWFRKTLDRIPGIYHRPLLPYKLKFETTNPALQPVTVVYLPNNSPILGLDILRAPFVKNEYDITFENGILTSVKWVKPSEALGFVNIPLDLAKAIVSIPSELLTVKVNDLTAEKGLLEAEKNLIQAQLDLIVKQKELGEAGGE